MTNTTAAACCGKDSWTTPGKPLVPSCMLCPSSPTYWRQAAARRAGSAPARDRADQGGAS